MAFPSRVIDGGDILLSVNGTVIGCATSHSLELSSETRDTSCKGSGSWSSMDVSRFAWSGSADVLFNLDESGEFTRYVDIWDLMISKTFIDIESTYSSGSDTFTQMGQAIITGLPLNAPDKENATFTMSFEGVGALSILGKEAFYLNITADNADYIVVEELKRTVAHSGTGVYNLPVLADTTGYTVTAFSSGGALVGSATTGAVAADKAVTVTLA